MDGGYVRVIPQNSDKDKNKSIEGFYCLPLLQKAYFYTVKFAKKKYGQHFLTNLSLVEQIASYVQSATESYTLNVIEVGPGRGVLTRYLMQIPEINLKVVEIDEDMIQVITSEGIVTHDQVIQADILKTDIRDLFGGEEFLVVGNFPYNISSQIVIKMLVNHQLIPALVGMFQKEMADRVLSDYKSKSYSRLTVLTGGLYTGKKLVKISPGSFNPPPKVDSMVIRLDRKSVIQPIYKEKIFRTVVALAFGKRRKMIRNTLKSLIQDETLLDNPYFTMRPEQLRIEDFAKLALLIQNQKK